LIEEAKMAERDLVIRIKLPRPHGISVALALVLMGGAAVRADVQWVMVKSGDRVSAATTNANFKAMADAITALQGQPAARVPHVVHNQGNVDLGVFLTSVGFSALLVHSPTFKAPYLLTTTKQPLYFENANCAGKAYWLPAVFPFANVHFSTWQGTVHQTAGVYAKFAYQSVFDSNGQCTSQMGNAALVLVKNTGMPNPAPIDPTETTLQLL
jgi:hypothetical protein